MITISIITIAQKIYSQKQQQAQKELTNAQIATTLEQAGINLLRLPFSEGEINGLVEAMRLGR